MAEKGKEKAASVAAWYVGECGLVFEVSQLIQSSSSVQNLFCKKTHDKEKTGSVWKSGFSPAGVSQKWRQFVQRHW